MCMYVSAGPVAGLLHVYVYVVYFIQTDHQKMPLIRVSVLLGTPYS